MPASRLQRELGRYVNGFDMRDFNGTASWSRMLKSLQSASIFSILNLSCSFMVYDYLSGSLRNRRFQKLARRERKTLARFFAHLLDLRLEKERDRLLRKLSLWCFSILVKDHFHLFVNTVTEALQLFKYHQQGLFIIPSLANFSKLFLHFRCKPQLRMTSGAIF